MWRTDAFGPGVIPNVRSYQYYHLYLDPSRLDPGYELGQENYTLLPTYKSGTLILAGSEATVMLGGVLTDLAGRPLALEGGEATRNADATAKPVPFFTNRKGKFRAEGFKPGSYTLTFFNDAWAPISIVIPETALGIYDIGRITAHPLK